MNKNQHPPPKKNIGRLKSYARSYILITIFMCTLQRISVCMRDEWANWNTDPYREQVLPW